MIINIHTDADGRLDTIVWSSDILPAEYQCQQVEVADDFSTDANPGDYILKDGALVYSPTVATVDLLKAQVAALTERNEFLEDCVAEMAERVYGE